MIIPSIDCKDNQVVQLIGGKELAIEAGDPKPIARKFGLAGEIAVIDLDAALGTGSNEKLIKDILHIAPCRVGGGIRSLEQAIKWLDLGATKVILGTAARQELLGQIPQNRVMAALDAVNGEVVVNGWTQKTGHGVIEKIYELKDFVSGFLVTFVEKEGRMQGIDVEQVKKIVDAASPVRVTIAGGVTTADDVRVLDDLGADAQVGMALYTGRLGLAEAIAAPMKSDRLDGLWPTVVVDRHGTALGLCWSNQQSLSVAIEEQRGVYWSRSRGLWRKGETSGATQRLYRIDLDCDRDCLRFVVEQEGSGFCHLNRYTCWGEDTGLPALWRLLASRRKSAPEGSYSKRLFNDSELLHGKILEEAKELCEAISDSEVIWEVADVLYFTLAKLASRGLSLVDVENELLYRSRKITRRRGDAK